MRDYNHGTSIIPNEPDQLCKTGKDGSKCSVGELVRVTSIKAASNSNLFKIFTNSRSLELPVFSERGKALKEVFAIPLFHAE